jgi:SAM-dependent methyltransferase
MRVVPWLLDRYAPRSVLDVGCGLGTWAAVFADHGCDVLGLDWVEIPDELLEIPRAQFRVVDLEGSVELPQRYDLALCLEVAEHLSEPAGRRLVRLLSSVSDVLVFSAAVPGQGGQYHINEQWPAYWQALFRAQGFRFEDEIRWRFWDDEEIEWWYRQNMFIVRRDEATSPRVHAVVHPRLLETKVEEFHRGWVPLRVAAVAFARALGSAVRRRLRALRRRPRRDQAR